jgi:glucose/arabinose dehydrogenase
MVGDRARRVVWLRRAVLVAAAFAVLAIPWAERTSLLGSASADAARQVAGTATLPTGFQDTIAFAGLSFPTAVRFASDGRVFVAQKNGLLEEFDSRRDSTPTQVADFRTETDDYWDRGFLGLALDPGFPAKPYVYALYAYDAPLGQTAPVWNDGCPTPPGPTTDGCPVQAKLVRLTLSGNSVSSSTTLISTGWCGQFPSHSVGDLNFGPDGNLYVSAGEGASFTFVDYGQAGGGGGSPTGKNPCADPPAGAGGIMTPPTAEGGSLRSQSVRRPTGEPVSLDGALLRIDPATGAAASDNPNIGSTNPNAQRILAYGMRNPFRFTFRPGTGEVWIGDVGQDTWEEVDRITSTSTMVNLGWPCYEGPNPMSGFQAAGLNMCTSLYSAPSSVTFPYYSYNHGNHVVANDSCSTANGSVISAISFYGGGTYPAAYNGALFFGDHSRSCIWAMLPGSNGLPDPSNIQTFVSPAAFPVDLETGPNGDLFYVDFDEGTIHRLSYQSSTCTTGSFHADYFNNKTLAGSPVLSRCETGIDYSWGAGSPDPSITAGNFSARWTGNFSFAAGTYAFTASTSDGARVWVDGTPVIDQWQDQPESVSNGTLALSAGIHQVKVEYYEGSGTAAAHVSWASAPPVNSPPVPVIDSPASSLTYVVGDRIDFSGHATDPEDGALPGSALTWTLLIHHCTTPTTCHVHFVQTFTGSSGFFNAPDHDYPSFIELQLTATDSQHSSTTSSVELQPKTVTLTFDSVPAGLTLAVGSSSSQTPFTRTVIANSLNSVSAPTPQSPSGTSYDFSSWSDGGAASHDLTAPSSNATYTATYAAAGGGGGGGGGGAGGGGGGGSAPPPVPTPAPTAPTLDLGVTLAGPVHAIVGEIVEYTAHLDATGSASAEDVGLRLAVPAGLAVERLPATCSASGATVMCHPTSAVTGGTAASFTVSFKAVAAGTNTVLASVASAATTDANSANNSASVSTSVSNAATALATRRPELAPAKPKRGKTFVASIAVVRAASGSWVRPSRISCSGRVGSRSVRALGTYRAGRAACRLTVPTTARRGVAVSVLLAVTVGNQKVSKRFTTRVG